MSKASEKNTRAKRKFLVWMQEARGLSPASVDQSAAAIDRWLAFTKGADFATFHVEKARSFKRSLEAGRNVRTGRQLSAGTIDGTLRALKAFFSWLAEQPGYKSKVLHPDVAYLTPSKRMSKAAHGGRWVEHPSPEQVLHTLRQMPDGDAIKRRDRAILAFLYLTGARDGALVTLRLRNVDLAAGCVHFEGPEVQSKFGKTFTTTFFPVGDEPLRIFEA